MHVRSLISGAALTAALLSLSSVSFAQTTYSDEGVFTTATGAASFESFENVVARVRGAAPVGVSGFTVTPDAATLGVLDGPDSPETTFGSAATDGTKALFIYQPGVPTGTLRFDLNSPTTFFGFDLIDAGETDGFVIVRTNAGETLSDLTLASYPPTFGNGNVQFLGFSQATPFTQVFLTITGVDEAYALDKVYVQSVPEPGVLVTGLVSAAPLGFLIIRRRRTAK